MISTYTHKNLPKIIFRYRNKFQIFIVACTHAPEHYHNKFETNILLFSLYSRLYPLSIYNSKCYLAFMSRKMGFKQQSLFIFEEK